MKDAPLSPTLSGPMEFANATTDTLILTVFAQLSLPSQLNAMSELISILNSKNACLALMDVLPVKLATIALNADLITLLMPNPDFVSKSVVMEKDTLLNVMMETTSMVMDAAKIADLKSDSHASEVHQLQETHAVLFSHQPFQLKTEVNPDFTERSS